MYVRNLDGRDAGLVVDMREEEARELISTGQAVAVDFSEAHPFAAADPTSLIEMAAEVKQPKTRADAVRTVSSDPAVDGGLGRAVAPAAGLPAAHQRARKTVAERFTRRRRG